MARELTPKSPSGRPKRAKQNVRNRLTVANRDPNFVYRVVNDVEDRVEILKGIGYEVCTADEVKVGDKRVDVSDRPVGSVMSISVGNGDRAVVMKIPKEYYEEDAATKQAEVDASEQTMKEKALDGHYGKLEISRG